MHERLLCVCGARVYVSESEDRPTDEFVGYGACIGAVYVSATDVAMCRCIVVLCFRYKISTQERDCDKYDNITDIFLCC